MGFHRACFVFSFLRDEDPAHQLLKLYLFVSGESNFLGFEPTPSFPSLTASTARCLWKGCSQPQHRHLETAGAPLSHTKRSGTSPGFRKGYGCGSDVFRHEFGGRTAREVRKQQRCKGSLMPRLHWDVYPDNFLACCSHYHILRTWVIFLHHWIDWSGMISSAFLRKGH